MSFNNKNFPPFLLSCFGCIIFSYFCIQNNRVKSIQRFRDFQINFAIALAPSHVAVKWRAFLTSIMDGRTDGSSHLHPPTQYNTSWIPETDWDTVVAMRRILAPGGHPSCNHPVCLLMYPGSYQQERPKLARKCMQSITILVCCQNLTSILCKWQQLHQWPLHGQKVWSLSGWVISSSQEILLYSYVPVWGLLTQSIPHTEAYIDLYVKCLSNCPVLTKTGMWQKILIQLPNTKSNINPFHTSQVVTYQQAGRQTNRWADIYKHARQSQYAHFLQL